jgi:hypothetical protein
MTLNINFYHLRRPTDEQLIQRTNGNSYRWPLIGRTYDMVNSVLIRCKPFTQYLI